MREDRVKGVVRSDLENQAKYGTVFLTWQGRTPMINVADPDIMKEIMLTDFYNFANKPNNVELDKMKRNALPMLEDDHWKYIRSLLSPTFSSGKLRQMAPILHECIGRLMVKFEQAEKTGHAIDVSQIYPNLTMEVILATAFGVAVDTHANPDDPFVKHALGVIQETNNIKPGVALAVFFPFLRPVLRQFKAGVLEFDPDGLLSRSLSAIIDQRKQEPQNTKVDLLQLMINAKADDVEKQKVEDGPEVDKDFIAKMTKKRQSRGLRDIEIVAQSSTFLLAGFETTNTLLTYLSYLLAYYPDVQERLAEEINEQLTGEQPTYDNVQKLQYLDMCVNECLRLYTPLMRMTRKTKTERLLKGFLFPRDSAITLLLYAVHHNPEFWPDPDTFDPERFSPENKPSIRPFTFVPFSGGPRNCIGMRFGLMEAKMALTSVLQLYRLELAPDMKDKVPLRPKGGNMMLGTVPTVLTVHKR
ncbi:cytochrome P450 3A8-like [Liolophura sinensis]|uniref:cytochrome P450 3A8-like n=1 Tax=Liolophura sinensis TaxID=3198878 RepID=UPI0031583590